MEAILNTTWVLLSLLAFGAGVMHHRTRKGFTHPTWLVAMVFAVIALLLFPVISVTDDLHPVVFASEDSSRRNLVTSIVHAPAASPALPAMPGATLVASIMAVSEVEPFNTSGVNPRAGFSRVLKGRDPPLPAE